MYTVYFSLTSDYSVTLQSKFSTVQEARTHAIKAARAIGRITRPDQFICCQIYNDNMTFHIVTSFWTTQSGEIGKASEESRLFQWHFANSSHTFAYDNDLPGEEPKTIAG